MTRAFTRQLVAQYGAQFPQYRFTCTYIKTVSGSVIHAVRAHDGTRTALIFGLPLVARAKCGDFAWGNEQTTRRMIWNAGAAHASWVEDERERREGPA